MYTLSPTANRLDRYLNLLPDVEAEYARQRAIVRARNYHRGDQFVHLTDRLRQFLADARSGRDSDFLRLNLTRIVTQAVLERLAIASITASDEALATFANDVYEASGGATMLNDLLEMALRDGESFLLADWDAEENRPRLIPHPRYVDAEYEQLGTRLDNDAAYNDYTDDLGDSVTTGFGFGCVAHFPNDDPSQAPTMVTKRWRETYTDPNGREQSRQRLTKYYPDRVEKYATGRGAQWEPITDALGEPWPIPLILDGEPIGILACHITNVAMACEAWEAIPLQNAINKTLIDLLQSGDLSAFRILFGAGWLATTDGQPLNATASNALPINPGSIISHTDPNSTLTAIEPGDQGQLLAVMQFLVQSLAMATDTPTARFTITGQVARAETIKAQEGPLVAKIVQRQHLFGAQLGSALRIAARLQQRYAPMGLPVDERPYIEWLPAETQDEKERLEVAGLKREKLGIPLQQVWREYGYSDDEITRMMAERMAMMPMIQPTATAAGNQPEGEPDDD